MMRRRFPRAAFALAIWASMLTVAPARALDFGDAEPVLDEDMHDMRGGFISAGGFEIGFGATVKTFVDGQLALETQLTWDQTGAIVESQAGVGDSAMIDLAETAQGQLRIPGLSEGASVALSDASGVTALIHRVVDGNFQNFIINTASDRDLRQEIDLNITLPAFESAQGGIALDRLGIRLNDEMAVGF